MKKSKALRLKTGIKAGKKRWEIMRDRAYDRGYGKGYQDCVNLYT